MKNYLIKLALLFTIVIVLLVSCSKSEDEIKPITEGYTGYYNLKDTYDGDLLLKIANSKESVSYYGSTSGSGIDILASLYKDNSSGRRTIYKVNSTADTSIVYDFDKPELGGFLFIKKNTNIVVQEFEFQLDKKTIKPILYLTTVSSSINSNRLSQSKFQQNKDDEDFLKAIEKELNDTASWFMTSGASVYIQGLDNARKKLLDDYSKIKNEIEEFLKNKSEKNPEPIQKEITEDPDPTLEPVNPISENSFIDCKNIESGYAFIDNCNICVGVGKGEKSCDCANSTLAMVVSITSNSATVNPIGGQPPYEYFWSNGSIGNTASNLVAGKTYLLEVKDKLKCTISTTVKVEGCNDSTLNVTTITSANTASAIATGGQSPYTYLWSNGSTSATATNLSNGNYTVTVTDALGCIKLGSTIVGLGFDLTGSWKINQSKSNCLDGDTFIVSFNSDSTFNLQNITSSSIYKPISYNLKGNNLIVVFSYQTTDMCDLTDSLYDANATVTISTTYEASTDSFMGNFDVYWKITPSCSGESNILICQDNISIIRN